MQILNSTYINKNVDVLNLTYKLFDLSSVKYSKHKLIIFKGQFESMLVSFKHNDCVIDETQSSAVKLFLSVVLNKLPEKIRLTMLRKLRGHDLTLARFRELFDAELEVCLQLQNQTSQLNKHTQNNNGQSKGNNNGSNKSKVKKQLLF